MKQACDDEHLRPGRHGLGARRPGPQTMVALRARRGRRVHRDLRRRASPADILARPQPGRRVRHRSGAVRRRSTYPEAIKKAAIFYPSLAGRRPGRADRPGPDQARLPLHLHRHLSAHPERLETQAQTLKNKGVEYVTIVDSANAAIGMLQAMSDADYHPKVVDLGQQYYDSTVAASGVADGALIQTNTQPFEEPNAAISAYVDLLKKTDPQVPVTSLGVQGFSAALLFATAAKKLGSKLTRTGLLDELHKVHDWDGGGLHPSQDPGRTRSTPVPRC